MNTKQKEAGKLSTKVLSVKSVLRHHKKSFLLQTSGKKVITIAHSELRSGELKKKRIGNIQTYVTVIKHVNLIDFI